MKRTIAEEIYRRHIRLYRELNDIHIFVSHTVPLLKAAASEGKGKFIDPDKDISIEVPGKQGRVGVAKRNATELSVLFKRYAHEELFANLLVTAVSRFEFYLSGVIAEFLRRSPKKLNLGPKGGDSAKTISLQLAVDADSLEDLYEEIIELRIQSVFYAEPKEYCTYFNAVTELGVPEKTLQPFFEIKASRDLVVHNSLLVNELYKKKAGELSRGEIGDQLKIKKDYFDKSLSDMKTISSVIERNARSKHGKEWEKDSRGQ